MALGQVTTDAIQQLGEPSPLGPSKAEGGGLINIVSPGFTVTENNLFRFTEDVRQSVRVRTPTGALSTPDDVAVAVLFLGSAANANITGTYLPVSGGIS